MMVSCKESLPLSCVSFPVRLCVYVCLVSEWWGGEAESAKTTDFYIVKRI